MEKEWQKSLAEKWRHCLPCRHFFCLKIFERPAPVKTGILAKNGREMRNDVERGREFSPHSVAVGSGLNDFVNGEDGVG